LLFEICMTMTNCELCDGKIKLGGYKGGRGYCGYYITHFNKQIYLRSMQEFVYAKYLDSIGVYYLTENLVYQIDEKNYKPDFFIYEGIFDKLKKIVEVKYTNGEKLAYQMTYFNFFRDIGIEYEVLSNGDIRRLIRLGIVTVEDLENWRSKFVEQYNKFDYSGERNPMYGIKHSRETRRKIGEQTKKFFQDSGVRKRHKDSRTAFWNSDAGNIVKKKYAKLRSEESIIKNPIIIRICLECGTPYNRKLKDKQYKLTCSRSCQQKYNWKIGKMIYRGNAEEAYKTKIKKYFRVLSNFSQDISDETYDGIVKTQKIKGNIPKHFGMNLLVVKKYFGSLENLKLEIY
jgi:hypothetical protein